MEKIDIVPTVNIRYLTTYTLQNVSLVQNKYLSYHEMSATVNKCQVSHLEMLGTYYPIAGRHETEMSYL